jgi:hypothetical protein
MFISETHFKSKSQVSIAVYNTCLANHSEDKAHGGSAILIKTKIAYTEQLCYAKPELQATIIQVQAPPPTETSLSPQPIVHLDII